MKTGGQGGNVKDRDDEKRVRVGVERVDDGDGVSVMLKLKLEVDDELDRELERVLRRLDDGVGRLKLKLEGNSKVMDDGMSGTVRTDVDG